MKKALLLFSIFLFAVSCDSLPSGREEDIIKWSQSPGVVDREQGHSFGYSFQRKDGSYLFITTAKHELKETGIIYEGGEVLKTGFWVYPGELRAANIEEAIKICKRIDGIKLKLNN